MKSFKKTLAAKGYTFQDWIGAEETDAFFAINPHGNTVVITTTKPSYKSDDHHFLISTKDTVQNETYKESLALFADLTGMCIITEDGMCFVEDDSVVNYFHNPKKPFPRHTIKHPLRYPVVKYSEIVSSPDDILDNSDLIHQKLSDHSTRVIAQNMEDLHDSLNRLNYVAKGTFDRTHSLLEYLLVTMGDDRSKIMSIAKSDANSEEHFRLKDILIEKERQVTNIADEYFQIQDDIIKLNETALRIHKNLERL